MADTVKKQWDGKSRGGQLGYQFFVHTIKLIGVRCAYCFSALIVIYFLPFAPRATKCIWKYNRQIRGLNILLSLKELYCHYYVFAQTLIDKIAIKGGLAKKYHFEFENYDRFLEIINGTQGVVMIGAHVGCWETGAVFFGKYGKKINIVMLDAEHQHIKEVLNKSAEQENNYKIIPLNQDVISTMLQIKVALNSGEYVCFNGDRFIDESTSETSPFLGQLASFPIGPFRIAAKCGVPVVFYYSMREQGRTYRFIFEEVTVTGRNGAKQLAQQYITSLENVVRKYPRQWFNYYDFWKSTRT